MSTRIESGGEGEVAAVKVTHCVECLMTWLLLGDGGECLLCRERVYWIGGDDA